MQEEEEQKKKVFSREDIIKFYNEWKSHLHNSQYDVVAVFLLETGLRAQEFAALQNSDIDLEKNIITIKRAVGKRFVDEDGGKVEEYLKVPKNKKQRIIYLSDSGLFTLLLRSIAFWHSTISLLYFSAPDASTSRKHLSLLTAATVDTPGSIPHSPSPQVCLCTGSPFITSWI